MKFDIPEREIDKLLERARDISERANQCVSSTTFNRGFNWCDYIFIGGEIKNYDDDWDKYLNFLFENLDIEDYKIETKYEESDSWREFQPKLSSSDTKMSTEAKNGN